MQSGLEVLTKERSPCKGGKSLRIEMFSHGSCSARGILREQNNIPAEGCLGAGNVPEGVG